MLSRSLRAVGELGPASVEGWMQAGNGWTRRVAVALIHVAALSCAVAGCGNTNTDPQSSTGGTPGAGGTGTGATSNTGGSPTGTDTLAGTWDYWVSTDSGLTSGTIEIAPDRFRFTVDVEESEFRYWDDAGTLGAVYNDSSDGSILDVTRTVAPLNTGALALSLGGSWIFSETFGTAQCAITLQQETFTWTCDGVGGTYWSPSPSTDLVGTRTRPLESMFGDLGGEWLVSEPSPGPSCTITFEGATFTADCTAAPNLSGSVTIGFSGNTASGTVTPSGEISALRQ